MIAWHYTIRFHLPSILSVGALLPADPFHAMGVFEREELRRFYGDEKPAVWFSLRQDWEPTADKGSAASRAETLAIGGGLLRFGVDERRVPATWTYHANTSGLKKKAARALERAAREKGANPSDWRVSYEPVPVTDCVIEVFNPTTERWDPHPR
jgi:hypothetical protein